VFEDISDTSAVHVGLRFPESELHLGKTVWKRSHNANTFSSILPPKEI
jgi:hypothetical protein